MNKIETTQGVENDVFVGEKLKICKDLRKFTSEALFSVLEGVVNIKESVSEAEFCRRWHNKLKENKKIYEDGWYMPPPYGMCVLFASEEDVLRVNFESIREKEYWPKEDIFLNHEKGIVYLYASPVDKRTGIIGDFGMSLYFGKDEKIRDHFKKCLEINKEIFKHIKPGMDFKEINKYANNLLGDEGLIAEFKSMSDDTETNIGHTIPASYDRWNLDELNVFKDGDSKKIADVIRIKRIFLSNKESFRVQRGMAFTVEPRPMVVNNSNLPRVSFHSTIVVDENGKMEQLFNYDEIFKLMEMDYL